MAARGWVMPLQSLMNHCHKQIRSKCNFCAVTSSQADSAGVNCHPSDWQSWTQPTDSTDSHTLIWHQHAGRYSNTQGDASTCRETHQHAGRCINMQGDAAPGWVVAVNNRGCNYFLTLLLICRQWAVSVVCYLLSPGGFGDSLLHIATATALGRMWRDATHVIQCYTGLPAHTAYWSCYMKLQSAWEVSILPLLMQVKYAADSKTGLWKANMWYMFFSQE